ncbi:MAG: ligase-associated DNA damage response DEXH box helicase [Alphaproteobacteria bacterium]|nr:ligase-associated DNA damage response DEXH box helicase [Alphaproteobacteria bacterium]
MPPYVLPDRFDRWFAARGWAPRPHQLALCEAAAAGRSVLLVAPTGGGKTLAGFLPSLIELAGRPGSRRARRLHTLYVSPLKALAVDIARNLEAPVAEMGLDIRLETRTGDTPAARRARQRTAPPDLLLTTPEQLALLIAHRDAPSLFGALHAVIVDELHALTGSKRGDLLSLGLARLRALRPELRMIGLSATVANPARLARHLDRTERVSIIRGPGGAPPRVSILDSAERVPWAGHSARHALGEILAAVRQARTALIFVNTRSQAEMIFQELWRSNEDNLPIALHHGSLAAGQRRKVEAAMVRGELRAVVCTSTLDLGIDWGAVDLVIQIGAPKGIARLLQRIGRANHRMDEPSRALLVPANRFEVLECRAALDALDENLIEDEAPRAGALDALAQHVLGMAVAGTVGVDALYAEVRTAEPYAGLERATFDRVVDFVATGGYALRSYEQYRRMRVMADGTLRITHPRVARQYRLNVGTIVEEPMVKVKLRRGRVLGEVEEYFIEQLAPGDTFLFAGEVLRFLGLREMQAEVSRTSGGEPKIPAYAGGKFPLSTFLAERVRRMLATPALQRGLPRQVRDWLALQRWRSLLPPADHLLVETFPRARRHYMVAYPFEGRLAHQTLGMLLTRRMERFGYHPLGFVANEYAVAVWSLDPPDRIAELLDQDMLGDDLEAWMAESSLLKRSFRNVALVAGLIERRHPGQEKSGRQVTFSSDLIYDVLRRHEPDHVLMQATWAEAARGLLDLGRLAAMLARVRDRIVWRRLDRISPLAVPVMLEIGREPVQGAARDALLEEAADELYAEAARLV